MGGEETARLRCLLGHCRALLLNVRAWVCSMRHPRSIPWGHPAADLTSLFACPLPVARCRAIPLPPLPPSRLGGTVPPGLGSCCAWLCWGLLCLSLCSWCPSLVYPCQSSIPKAAVGVPLMVVAAPQKGFPMGSVTGSLLTPSHCGVGGCVLLWGHTWGGQLVWGSPVLALEWNGRVLGYLAGLGSAGDEGSVCRRCRGWRASL